MATESSAESLASLGAQAFAAGDYAQALTRFKAAAAAFTATGDVLMAARMANNMSVALLKQGQPDEALAASLGTEDIFANAGDIALQAMALGNQASALSELKRFEEALAAFRQAAALFKEARQPDYEATILQNMSTLQLRMKQPLIAMGTMAQALDIKPHLSIGEKLLRGLLSLVVRLMGGKI